MTTHELIDRFCESRRRPLIVTGVTFVVAIVTLLPQVDQYLSLRADEAEKTDELEEAGRTAELLAGLRMRVAETTGELQALEQRTLPAAAVPRFRNTLVNMVRESGCQVRRVNVGSVAVRRWREEDSPLASAKDKAGKDTPFQLETRPVNLSVTGSMTETKSLLSKIESSGMLVHAHSIDLRPTGRGNDVQMDLELWCFALDRARRKA